MSNVLTPISSETKNLTVRIPVRLHSEIERIRTVAKQHACTFDTTAIIVQALESAARKADGELSALAQKNPVQSAQDSAHAKD